MLSDFIKSALNSSTHHQELLAVMDYAVFPAGKLFRPRLVQVLTKDLLGEMEKPHLHLASALELHHAYTLVHDDLPAMDNDLTRRGKPSTHAAFGEWKAILAGDALLISSFEELMKMKHPRALEVHKLFTWATGAKGLISGQFLDLKAQGKLTLPEVIRIHELKTARLIQVATVGSYLLCNENVSLKGMINFLRLGREIGVSFQLLDDLNELTDAEVSDHEREINPFLMNPQSALQELDRSLVRLKEVLKRQNLKHLESMLKEYFQKNQSSFQKNRKTLEKNLECNENFHKDLSAWITSFAEI